MVLYVYIWMNIKLRISMNNIMIVGNTILIKTNLYIFITTQSELLLYLTFLKIEGSLKLAKVISLLFYYRNSIVFDRIQFNM